MAGHKNQHVTPQVILKHFASENKVHIYDTIANKKPSNSHRTIEKVSTRKNFYDFNQQELKLAEKTFKEKVHTKYVEIDFLAHNIENSLGKLLPNIIEKDYSESDVWIGKKEKADLSFYITIQFLRSPLMKKLLSELGCSVNEEATKLSLPEYNSPAQDHLGLHHYSLMTDSKVLTEIGTGFFDREWTLAVNKTEMPFFISDNPVVIRESNPSQMVYPLSSKYLIIMDNKNKNKDSNIHFIDDDDIDTIKQFNTLQLRQSEKDVFSEKDCFDWITINDVKKTNIHQLLEQKDFFQTYITTMLLTGKIIEGFVKTGHKIKPKTKPKKKKRKKRR